VTSKNKKCMWNQHMNGYPLSKRTNIYLRDWMISFSLKRVHFFNGCLQKNILSSSHVYFFWRNSSLNQNQESDWLLKIGKPTQTK